MTSFSKKNTYALEMMKYLQMKSYVWNMLQNNFGSRKWGKSEKGYR